MMTATVAATRATTMMMTDVVGDDDDNERRRSKWQRLAVAMAVTGTATGLMNATMAPLTDEDDDWLAAAMGDCGGDDGERRCRRRRPR